MGEKLVWILVVQQQQILLYSLPDGGRVNWVGFTYCSDTTAQWMGLSDVLGSFNDLFNDSGYNASIIWAEVNSYFTLLWIAWDLQEPPQVHWCVSPETSSFLVLW